MAAHLHQDHTAGIVIEETVGSIEADELVIERSGLFPGNLWIGVDDERTDSPRFLVTVADLRAALDLLEV